MNEKIDINYSSVKKIFLDFIGNKLYIFSLVFIAILTYGFYLINISIGIDDLAIGDYVKGPYLLASGRYTFVLIGWILNYFSFTPFWIEFFCLTVLIIALILINVLLKIASNDKLPVHSYTIFSIMFLSYSIISEALIYQENAMFLAFGYLFTILSVLYTYSYIANKVNKSCYLAIAYFILALGLYETFLSVYLLLMIITMILQLYYSKISLKIYTIRILEILFYSLTIRVLLQGYLNINHTENFSNQRIYWFVYSVQDILKMFSGSFFHKVIYQSILYLPFTILIISFLIYIILLFKIKNNKIRLLVPVMFVSAFILQIIMGIFVYNRTLNSLSVYVSFSFCLLYAIIQNTKVRKAILILVVYLCLLSSKDINNELYKDFKRYNYEKSVINQTAFMINNKFGYTEKPVIFLGELNEPFRSNYNSEIGNSSINWSISAFKNYMSQTQKLFLEQGYKFNLPSSEQVKEATEIYKDMPRFPEEGSVKLVNDEYIIVRY